MDIPKLSGGAIDTMRALARGPQFDGDIPSKAGRTELIELGLARRERPFPSNHEYRGCIMNELTDAGAQMAAHYHPPQSFSRN